MPAQHLSHGAAAPGAGYRYCCENRDHTAELLTMVADSAF